MNFEFNREQKLLRQAVREFAEQEVAPRVGLMEQTREMPAEVIQGMASLGFPGVGIPAEFGGTGMGALARVIILEELGRISAAVAAGLQAMYQGIDLILAFGTAEQKQEYLPGLAVGQCLAATAAERLPFAGRGTEAEWRPDGWVLNGGHNLILNSHLANLAIVVARTQSEPRRQYTAFIVPRSGWRPGRLEDKFGLHGCAAGEIIMENCLVTPARVLGDVNNGQVLAGKVSENNRFDSLAIALGIMQASLEAAARFAGQRVLYRKPIGNLQAIQFKMAEIYTGLEASRLLAYKLAWSRDQGHSRGHDVTTAAEYVMTALDKATRQAMDIHGGYGCVREYPVERYSRDAQMLALLHDINPIP